MNIRHMDRQRLEDFIDVSRAVAKEDEWVLVVHQVSYRDEEVYQYYYVVHSLRTITWLEDLDGYLLFRECIQASEWRHKSRLLCDYIFLFLIVIIQGLNSRLNIGERSTKIVSLTLCLTAWQETHRILSTQIPHDKLTSETHTQRNSLLPWR